MSICPSRELSATEGEVTSPDYPSEYPVNTDCTLAIDGGNNVKLKIKFVSFEVEEDEDGEFSINLRQLGLPHYLQFVPMQVFPFKFYLPNQNRGLLLE